MPPLRAAGVSPLEVGTQATGVSEAAVLPSVLKWLQLKLVPQGWWGWSSSPPAPLTRLQSFSLQRCSEARALALGRTGGMRFPWELPKFSSQSRDVAAGFGAKCKVRGAGRGLAIHCQKQGRKACPAKNHVPLVVRSMARGSENRTGIQFIQHLLEFPQRETNKLPFPPLADTDANHASMGHDAPCGPCPGKPPSAPLFGFLGLGHLCPTPFNPACPHNKLYI